MSDEHTNGASSPEDALIEETLTPLLTKKNELADELRALEAGVSAKREQIRTVEKVLRAGGLLEATDRGGSRKRGSSYQGGISDKMLDLIRTTVEEFPKHQEFTKREINEKTGKDLTTIAKALDTLRTEGLIRLTGQKVPEGSVGYAKAAHFARIGD